MENNQGQLDRAFSVGVNAGLKAAAVDAVTPDVLRTGPTDVTPVNPDLQPLRTPGYPRSVGHSGPPTPSQGNPHYPAN